MTDPKYWKTITEMLELSCTNTSGRTDSVFFPYRKLNGDLSIMNCDTPKQRHFKGGDIGITDIDSTNEKKVSEEIKKESSFIKRYAQAWTHDINLNEKADAKVREKANKEINTKLFGKSLQAVTLPYKTKSGKSSVMGEGSQIELQYVNDNVPEIYNVTEIASGESPYHVYDSLKLRKDYVKIATFTASVEYPMS